MSKIFLDGNEVSGGDFNVDGNLGVNMFAGSDMLSIQDSGVDTIAALAATLLTNGDFVSDLSSWTAGAGWSWNSGTALHTAGNTATLTQGAAVTNGGYYHVSVTVSGRTAGSVVVTLQNSTGSITLTGDTTYTYSFIAGSTATNNLIFTPTTDFDGALDDVTIQLITPASEYNLCLYDVGGARSGLAVIASDDSLYNLFLGIGCGRYNTSGSYNFFAGTQSGLSNTTGRFNYFSGPQAGYTNTVGNFNTFAGAQSGFANSLGNKNMFAGYYSGRGNTTGSSNSFVGSEAGVSNTTGSSNSFVGEQSGYGSTTGDNNVFVGKNSGRSNVGGGSNAFTGADSGRNNTSGSSNIFVGYWAGHNNTTGSSCVVVGDQSALSGTGDTNEIVLGATVTGLGSNTANIGNASITVTRIGGLLYLDKDTAYTSAPVSSMAIGRNATSGHCWIQAQGAAAAEPIVMQLGGGSLGIGAVPLANMVDGDLLVEGGSVVLKEITTPTADANYGKIYPKNDNKLYFQDGAGAEHEIAFV